MLDAALRAVPNDIDFLLMLEQTKNAHADILISEANAFMGNKDFGKALTLLGEGEWLYPENAAIKQSINNIQAAELQHIQDREVAAAIETIDALLDKDRLPQALAAAEEISMKYPANSAAIEKLEVLRSMDIEDMFAEAELLLVEYKITEADDLLRAMLSKYSDNITARTNYEKAQELLTIAIAGYKADVQNEVAEAEADKAYLFAVDILNAALTIVPNDAGLLLRLEQTKKAHADSLVADAAIIATNKNFSEALTLLKEGESLYPGNDTIKQKIANIRMMESEELQIIEDQEVATAIEAIDALLEGNNLPQALAVAQNAHEEYPGNTIVLGKLETLQSMDIETVVTEVKLLMEERKYTQADDLLRALLGKYPDNIAVQNTVSMLEAEIYPALRFEDATNIGNKFTKLTNAYDNYSNSYGRAVKLAASTSETMCQILLGENYSRFKGTFFVELNNKNYHRSRTFRIELDGKVIYSPTEINKSSKPIYVDISVAGGNDLRIIVSGVHTSHAPHICVGDAGFFE